MSVPMADFNGIRSQPKDTQDNNSRQPTKDKNIIMANFFETSSPVPSEEQPKVTTTQGFSDNNQRWESFVNHTDQVQVATHHKVDFRGSHEAPTMPGIVGTGQNPGGLRITSTDQIKSSTLFHVDGLQMNADNLVALGLLTKDKEGGGYRLPSGSQEAAPEKQQAQQATPKVTQEEKADIASSLDKVTSYAMEVIHENAGRNTDGVVVKALVSLTSGQPLSGELASSLRLEPEQAEVVFSEAYGGYVTATANHLSKTYGVNGEDVLDYLSESLSESKRVALAHRVYLGDQTVFPEMVSLYRRRPKPT